MRADLSLEYLAHSAYRTDRPIPDDGFSDEIAAYNRELEQRGNPTWMNVAWLYCECYLYRYAITLVATWVWIPIPGH